MSINLKLKEQTLRQATTPMHLNNFCYTEGADAKDHTLCDSTGMELLEKTIYRDSRSSGCLGRGVERTIDYKWI